MDSKQFKIHGKELIDFIVDFKDQINNQSITPSVEPGYLSKLIPDEAPREPETFEAFMKDFKEKILKGVLYWNHRRFHAYFPAGDSYPSLIGDMLSDMLNMIGFSWQAGPSLTELEVIVLDWFAKAMALPRKFLSSTTGGGVIQDSASECVISVFLAARDNAIESLKGEFGANDDNKIEKILPKLVAYTGRESHSSVAKAARLCLVNLRILETTDNGNVEPETLEKAMAEDEKKGLKPFLFSAVLGSTVQAAFDDLELLSPVIKKQPAYFWFHVDGAYGGSSLICPEMSVLANGIENANSFNVSPSKWLLTHFDCSVLWVDDRTKYCKAFVIDPIYLQPKYKDNIDRRFWQIPLSKRFRALKLWSVFQLYGIENLQKYIRNHIKQARYFMDLIEKDTRFEICNVVRAGVVCFRLKDDNTDTYRLLSRINKANKILLTPARIKNKYVIRFCVDYEHATQEDMDYAYAEIKEHADKLSVPEAVLEGEKKKPELVYHHFDFTKGVSKEQYKHQEGSLHDEALPIFIIDEKHSVDDVDTDVTGHTE